MKKKHEKQLRSFFVSDQLFEKQTEGRAKHTDATEEKNLLQSTITRHLQLNEK